jgi:hypothetical protein
MEQTRLRLQRSGRVDIRQLRKCPRSVASYEAWVADNRG